MKVLRLGRHVRGGALGSSKVSLSRWHGAHVVRTAFRYQSQWTPHPLTGQALSIGAKELSGSSKRPLQVHTAYIALGSNLGDRIGYIEKACKLMSKRGLKIKRTSSLWETEPMYVLDQGNFINGVCEVRSESLTDRA